MQWWRVVGAIGRFMMRAGVLVLLFVVYQLWGTGLATGRAQDRLESEFAAQLEQAAAAGVGVDTTLPPVDTTTEPDQATTTTTAAPTTAPVDLPVPNPGDPVGRIVIPTVGVDFMVVQGVDLKWLKEGPGHFPQTPLPGQPGNAALAGHRTTYAAPFNRLDELAPGDDITIETLQGTFTYRVDPHDAAPGEPPKGHFIVNPTQVEILEQDGTDRLTLVACHPKYSAAQRIVVTATLVSNPAPPTPLPEPEVTGEGDDAQVVTVDASVDALAGGDTSARLPAVLWSALAIAIWVATWYAGRHWHKLPAYLVGTPIFAVVLFVAYENIARLLPAAF